MNVSVLGTNGLLANSIGKFCNEHNYNLDVYGRTMPIHHTFNKFVKIDFLKERLQSEDLIKSDIIIYCAGAGIQSGAKEDLNSIYDLNVSIPIFIFNLLKDQNFNGTFITFGSYFEIGENIIDTSYTEVDLINSMLKAPNDYTVSKRTLTRFISSAKSLYTFYHFILPTIYGENESPNRLIPYTLKAIKEDADLKFTAGDQVRQYIYINDVIEIIFSCVQSHLNTGIYNISGTEEFSVKELVTLLFDLMLKNIPSDVFGKTDRIDVGMKVLKLNGEALKNKINYSSNTKISDVYGKYNFE